MLNQTQLFEDKKLQTVMPHLKKQKTTSGVLTEGYAAIQKYFDALNADNSHFQNTNDICTPIGCVKEMVDSVPNEFWKKPVKILDSCCGNGNFHAYIQMKTNLNNLYFNEINEKRINNLLKIFGENINLTKRDFLTFDDDEQFDMVVSNPPYALFNGDKRVSKNHNLSRAFIRKALTITKPKGYLLFIVPNNWMSLSDRNDLPRLMSNYQFLHLNIGDAKKWFPTVGSSFTWFLLQKSPNEKPFKIVNGYGKTDTQKTKIDKGSEFVPLYFSDEVRRIFNKTINAHNEKYKVETTSFLHRYTKRDLINDVETPEHRYRLIHTPTQTLWSSKPHKYQNGWKVFISLSNQYSTFIDNCGMTQSIAFIRCNSLKQAKQIKKELDSDIFFFLNNLTRYGNFNNIRILQKFPLLKSIKLTDKEKAYIKSFLS